MESTQLLCVAVDTLVLLVHLQVIGTTRVSLANLACRCCDLGRLVMELQSYDCVSLEVKETKIFPSSWREDFEVLANLFSIILPLNGQSITCLHLHVFVQ